MEKNLKQEPSTCLKIVLFGPESTGKTSLAKQLASHYKTLWVPEFSREFAESLTYDNEQITEEDILTIASGQMGLENTLSKVANTILICDTDLLETMVYADLYFPQGSYETLTKYALVSN